MTAKSRYLAWNGISRELRCYRATPFKPDHGAIQRPITNYALTANQFNGLNPLARGLHGQFAPSFV
jgi:hypothetical protein